ncbi:hypothetical protein [Glycomyces sp. NPDC021274]|uniref:hypothetical protein n=1 Tax=Glycomyces sp. NPDC021274 TaxID=3155120 RepID=UPI0033DBC654
MTDTQTRPNQLQAAAPRRGRGLPLWIGAAVYAAAMPLWGLRAAAGHVPALMFIAAATAIAVLIVRSRTDAGSRPAQAAVYTAGVWVGLFAAFGIAWWLTALWATALGAFWPAWRRHLAALAAGVDQLPTEPEFEPELVAALAVMDLWVERVANRDPLKGTQLKLLKTDGRVHHFAVGFIPGKHTYSQLVSQREAIASAMDVPEENVTIEKARTAASALFTVITDVADRPPVMYPGPSFDPATGLVTFAKYDLDHTPVVLSVVDDNGAYGATFCGDQGSGKSACMENVGLSLLASGYFVGLYVDPQGGMSSPMLAEACKWTARSVAEAAELIRALPRWRRLRQIVFRRMSRNGYRLSKEHPVVVIFMDEFQEIACGLSKDDQQILVDMAKTLRKVGGCLMIGTQNVGLAAFGGNNDLRTQLMSRNVVYFYTSSKQQGNLSGRNDFDPSTLPSGTPGYGYVKELRVKGKLITRAAPIRAFFFGHDADFGGLNAGLAWLRHVRKSCRFADLPAAEVGALGAAFARRDRARAAADATDEAFLAACEAAGKGELDPDQLDEFDPGTAAKPKPEQQPAGDGLPSLRLGGPEEQPADQYPGKTKAILEALRAGAWGTTEIIRRAANAGVTVSSSHVEQTLPKLIDEGKAFKVGTGHYHAHGAPECERPGCGG